MLLREYFSVCTPKTIVPCCTLLYLLLIPATSSTCRRLWLFERVGQFQVRGYRMVPCGMYHAESGLLGSVGGAPGLPILVTVLTSCRFCRNVQPGHPTPQVNMRSTQSSKAGGRGYVTCKNGTVWHGMLFRYYMSAGPHILYI